MAITAADIRREVKEKNVTFLRLMFSDILGVMKNVEIPATDERNAEHDERGRQAGNEEIGHECIAFNPCVERCERKENRQAAV